VHARPSQAGLGPLSFRHIIMNTLSTLASSHPSLLSPGGSLGAGGLAPNNTPVGGATGGAAGTSRQAGSWLDQGAQGPSEVLHVGPNSGPRAIEDIERDFVQALCQQDASPGM
jgi:hypothetical protein